MAGNVVSVLARIYVDDLDAAMPLYERLTGATPHRFDFRHVRLATVAPFLLIEGADDEIRSRAATVCVGDLDEVVRAIEAAGGTCLEGPAAGPNGRRLIARHPDGSILEYIETDL